MLIFTYNIKTISKMKDLILTRVFQVWAIGTGLLAVSALVVAIFNLVTGNYTGTASFEF